MGSAEQTLGAMVVSDFIACSNPVRRDQGLLRRTNRYTNLVLWMFDVKFHTSDPILFVREYVLSRMDLVTAGHCIQAHLRLRGMDPSNYKFYHNPTMLKFLIQHNQEFCNQVMRLWWLHGGLM